ncbi:Uncharacterised protein [Serratia fonticola]|uniref:Uncharacterized protein n=1 Tax=Serratia fonticola TaxID=47917 RepID=A0A4U9V728_SERFO|nr:Uncharacterised protein [Serratia fonticola]
MNEEFTFYDDIGMVRQQATCRRRDAELTAQLNHWSVYDGYIDGEVFYFLNGIKTARPDLIRFENGKLKGIPKGETFFIEQQEFQFLMARMLKLALSMPVAIVFHRTHSQ